MDQATHRRSIGSLVFQVVAIAAVTAAAGTIAQKLIGGEVNPAATAGVAAAVAVASLAAGRRGKRRPA